MTSLHPAKRQPARRIPPTAPGSPATRLLAAAILCAGVLGAAIADVGTAAADPLLCPWGPGAPTDCSDLFTPTPPDSPAPDIIPAYPPFQSAPSQIELPPAQPDPTNAP